MGVILGPPLCMSEASTLPGLLPSPKGLRHELELLAEAIRDDLQRGENHGAAFVRFTTKAFQPGEDASCAANTLIEIFRDRREILEVVARAVDVALELQCGCAVLASEVVHLWDQPKADHKLARLADEIFTEPARYQNDLARAFILDLARRLALQRPELAGRLIEMMPETENAPAARTVRVWLKCGVFLRSQTESVRFFWERHLRDPKRLQDWSRSCVRPSVAAVRTALIDEEVREVFRNSVPEDVWKDTRPSVGTTPVPVMPRTLPMQAVPEMPTEAIHAVAAHNVRRVRKGAAMKCFGEVLPWGRIAAVLTTLGALIWLMTGNKPETAVAAGESAEPSLPVKMADMPRPSVQEINPAETQAPSQAPVKTNVAMPPNTAKSANVVTAKPQARSFKATMAETTSATIKSDNMHRSAPAAMGAVVEPLASMRMRFSHAKPTQSLKSPQRPSAAVTLAEKPPGSPERPSGYTSAAPSTGEPSPTPREIVARPAIITAYDRWLMLESHKLAQRYPELIQMQRKVVNGAWTPSNMRLNGMQPVTADPERYAALVRWLVVDPPLSAETRKSVLAAWKKVATPDECIDLWEQLLKYQADHSADIGQAAHEWLKRPGMAFSANQLSRLQRIAAGRVN